MQSSKRRSADLQNRAQIDAAEKGHRGLIACISGLTVQVQNATQVRDHVESALRHEADITLLQQIGIKRRDKEARSTAGLLRARERSLSSARAKVQVLQESIGIIESSRTGLKSELNDTKAKHGKAAGELSKLQRLKETDDLNAAKTSQALEMKTKDYDILFKALRDLEFTHRGFLESFEQAKLEVMQRDNKIAELQMARTSEIDEHRVGRTDLAEPESATTQGSAGIANPASVHDMRAGEFRSLFFIDWELREDDENRLTRMIDRQFKQDLTVLDKVLVVDKHVVGDFTKLPTSPKPCIWAALARHAGSATGRRYAENCDFCSKSKTNKSESICLWAEFAPGVESGFSERGRNGQVMSRTRSGKHANVKEWLKPQDNFMSQ